LAREHRDSNTTADQQLPVLNRDDENVISGPYPSIPKLIGCGVIQWAAKVGIPRRVLPIVCESSHLETPATTLVNTSVDLLNGCAKFSRSPCQFLVCRHKYKVIHNRSFGNKSVLPVAPEVPTDRMRYQWECPSE
jgi:hypothetical protein